MNPLRLLYPSSRTWPPEDSITLRVAATGAICVGIAACETQGQLPPVLAGVAGALVVVGNVFSYRFRRRSMPQLKLLLGTAMLAAFVWFFFTVSADASAGAISEVERPLAMLFALMQAAHSFDVPSRRDLAFSLAGSATLVAVASSQAVDLAFGLFLVAWAAFSVIGLGATWSSMSGGGRIRPAWVLVPAAAAVVVAALLVAVLPAPRTPAVAASQLGGAGGGAGSEPSHLVRAGEQVREQSASASGAIGVGGFLGFAGPLDTAVRPSLGNQLVLRVKADRPTFWLAETFDTWSGRSWSESGPSPRATPRGDAHGRSPAASESGGASGVSRSSRWETLTGGPPFLIGPSLLGPLEHPTHPASGKSTSEKSVAGALGTPDYQTFYLATTGTDLVLHASNANAVWFPSRRLYVSSDGTIESGEALGAGSVYSVLSTVATPTASELEQANGRSGLTAAVLASSLQLPRAYPRVAALARRITAGQSTDYGTVTALERWMGRHTKYTLDIPPLGSGQDTVDQFLFVTRRGYCEQISTALAVMLRTLGIPAREAAGYVPGAYDPITGLYDEEAKDAHAWVQVWFPGYGWQSFDPTAFVPLANPSAGSTFAHDVAGLLHRIPLVPTAPIAVVLALVALAAWLRRRRPARWRAAVTKELERAARRAGVAVATSDTLGSVAVRVDAVLDGRAGAGPAAAEVAAAAERAAWQSADPDRATARRHVRRARRVRRAARGARRDPLRRVG